MPRPSVRLPRALTCSVALVGALAATLLPAGARADAAGSSVALRADRLEVGTYASPRVVGHRIVDGDTSVRVPGRRLVLLGRSGDGYVVTAQVGSGDGVGGVGPWVTKRVVAGGSPTVLATGPYPLDVRVSDSGRQVAITTGRTSTRTTVAVKDAVSGEVVGTRRFPGVASILDVDRGKVVMGGREIGLATWKPTGTAVRRLGDQQAYAADLDADRVASFTGDPYEGGCSTVARLSRPAEALSSSCTERVMAFAPDGKRMATIDLLSDGIGPTRVWARGVGGRLVTRYTTGSYFGEIAWESSRALLLGAYGRDRGALVRCVAATCERAGELVPTPMV